MSTTTTTKTAFRPSPMAALDGEYVTPAQFLTRWLIDGGADWIHRENIRRRASVTDRGVRAIVREFEESNYLGVSRYWEIVDATSGRILPGYAAGEIPNPIEPNGPDLVIRVDNGAMHPNWEILRYSPDRGWVVHCDYFVVEDIEPIDDEGMPNLCERCDIPRAVSEFWDEIEHADEDPEEIPADVLAVMPFADFFADGSYLCTEHFEADGPIHYTWSHRVGEPRTSDPVGVWDHSADYARHAVATGMGTHADFASTAGTYSVEEYQPIEETTADRMTRLAAVTRWSTLLRESADRADSARVELVADLWERGEIEDSAAVESGLGERWMGLTREIRAAREEIENR